MFEREIVNEKFKHLIGKEVSITIDDSTFFPMVLHFVGRNMVGQDVITTGKPHRATFYVDDWSKVNITQHNIST